MSAQRWWRWRYAGGLLALDFVRGPTVWSCLAGSRCEGAPVMLGTLVFGNPAQLLLMTIFLGAACVWAYDRESVRARRICWGALSGLCVVVLPDVWTLMGW